MILENDPRWKLAERIVVTQGLIRSPRLSSLLLHVVRQSLEGRESELNEQLIGERIFGRPVGYDPRDDNIVRAHASRLRQKLDAYYREEGKSDPMRVTIPRGSYVPIFERVDATSSAENSEALSAGDVKLQEPIATVAVLPSAADFRWLWAVGGVVAAVLLLALAHTALGLWTAHKSQQDPTDRLWAALFSKTRPSLIVPADSGLIVLKSLTGHAVGATDYASGRYLSTVTCEAPCDRHVLEMLAAHRYTSLADLQFAVDLNRLPEAVANHPEIRYSRDLQLDDLKKDNLVLIGSLESDPWLQFFQSKMNFVLHDDRNEGALKVENKRPAASELSSYVYDRDDPSHRGYALVAFLPNLGEDGDVLIVQGFTLADTQAAADFVTNHRDFNAVLGPIVAKRHGLPHFEILLRTMDINGFGSSSSIVTTRIY